MKYNLALTKRRFRIIPEFSFTGLTRLLNEAVASRISHDQGFDWVYIDGSHRADDTFLDGELVWRLTRQGGLIIFDDYLWDSQPETSILHPKRGIDAFLLLHEGEYERLSERRADTEGTEYQVVIRKLIAPRLGYLLPVDPPLDSSPTDLLDSLEYRMNIALAANSDYAMPLSVLLTSLLLHTPGQISLYILDCGLTDTDIANIRSLSSHRHDVTTVILPLPDTSLTRELAHAVWAKIDLIQLLPVERVLYLDADILIRKDIHPLWITDLHDHAIGAALDVGHPKGHDGVSLSTGSRYFNAGVLLLDLSKLRVDLSGLHETCRRLQNAPYADQDALNAHFSVSGGWEEFSVRWNAQGLGTYAKYEAPGREWIDKGGMDDPSVVHFTGPLHPPLEMVLYPYTQPYTSKPWGYARAPGHPFAEEWLEVLKTTGYYWEYFNGEWKTRCGCEMEGQITDAGERLREKLKNL